jgi:molybdenum cofactor biosynthesis enzyme
MKKRAIVAAMVAWMAAAAAFAETPAQTAKMIQDGCVRRGENAVVCACGVGIAYSKLEPRTFALIPQVDPLLDEPDKSKQMGGLLALTMSSGLSMTAMQAAYDTIRSNRDTVKQICKPLAPARR